MAKTTLKMSFSCGESVRPLIVKRANSEQRVASSASPFALRYSPFASPGSPHALRHHIGLDAEREGPAGAGRNADSAACVAGGNTLRAHADGIDQRLVTVGSRRLGGFTFRYRPIDRRRIGDRPKTAHEDPPPVATLLGGHHRGLEVRPGEEAELVGAVDRGELR